MDSFSALIDKLGGPAKTARAVDMDPGTGRQWKRRNNIPATYWSKLIDHARDRRVKGVTIEMLGKLAMSTMEKRAPQ